MPAILQIVTPYGRGSGCFVASDLVLTAGHVIQPHTPGPVPLPLIKVVLPDGSFAAPASGLPHPRWSLGFNADADMAVLRVAPSYAALVLETSIDQPASGLDARVAGFDAAAQPVARVGTVDRVPHPGGFDALISSDLAFPGGVSGGPMFGPDNSVFGIATWSPPAPTPNAFVGIPLLQITFNWLQAHCP